MLPWSERPSEIANLFNPAFCALLLKQAINEYEKTAGNGFDYPVAFLILPLVLHKASRENLPTNTRTKLHIWIQEHQEIRIGLEHRIHSLAKFTKEAIIFGLQHNIMSFDENGRIIVAKRRLANFKADGSEAADCYEKAGMLGRWFGSINNTNTLLAIWGINF